MSDSYLEKQFESLWVYLYPNIHLHSEYAFSKKRKFRLDYCHIESRVGIEIQGGIWMAERSGHSTGVGIARDCEKLSLATASGYALFYLTDSMISEEWCASIAQTIQRRLLVLEQLKSAKEYIVTVE